MENKIKENKKEKKENGSTIVIILLIIVILGLVCYLCYDKGIILSDKKETSESEKNNKNNKSEEENIEFSQNELEKYVNYILPSGIGVPGLIYDENHVISQKLTAADKIKYIGSYVYSKHTTSSDYSYEIISEENVKNSVEEIYGPNTYERTTFNLGFGDYTFNDSDNSYYSKTGWGGTTDTGVANVIIGYKATKKKLEITTAYALYNTQEHKIYKDCKGSIVLDSFTDENAPDIKTYMNEYVKREKDNLYHIVYTFESNDGRNYYFKEFVNNKQ